VRPNKHTNGATMIPSDPDPHLPIRDRSIEQLAAARNILAAVGRVADSVRRGGAAPPDEQRDALRAAFGELARAGIVADDCEHAIAAAVSLLAVERAALVAVPAVSPPPVLEPARHDGPAAFVLARVRPLLELGEHVTIKIASPRAALCELARRVRVAAFGCGVATTSTLSTMIQIGAIDLTIVEPNVEPSIEDRRAAAAAAGFALERLAVDERLAVEERANHGR
jgi:hypothetical protein